MSGDGREESAAKRGVDGEMEELSISDERGLMCGGVVRGHGGGERGRMDGWWDRGTRMNVVARRE